MFFRSIVDSYNVNLNNLMMGRVGCLIGSFSRNKCNFLFRIGEETVRSSTVALLKYIDHHYTSARGVGGMAALYLVSSIDEICIYYKKIMGHRKGGCFRKCSFVSHTHMSTPRYFWLFTWTLPPRRYRSSTIAPGWRTVASSRRAIGRLGVRNDETRNDVWITGLLKVRRTKGRSKRVASLF